MSSTRRLPADMMIMMKERKITNTISETFPAVCTPVFARKTKLIKLMKFRPKQTGKPLRGKTRNNKLSLYIYLYK